MKNIRLYFSIVFLGLFTCLATPAQAAAIYVNGNYLNTPLTISKGVTLVPLRVIFEKLGSKVAWSSSSHTITAEKGTTKISLKINSSIAYINNRAVKLQVPAKVIKSNTMVPLRFVSEALGASVAWIPSSKTVTIASKIGENNSTVDSQNITLLQSADSIYNIILAAIKNRQASIAFSTNATFDLNSIKTITKKAADDFGWDDYYLSEYNLHYLTNTNPNTVNFTIDLSYADNPLSSPNSSNDPTQNQQDTANINISNYGEFQNAVTKALDNSTTKINISFSKGFNYDINELMSLAKNVIENYADSYIDRYDLNTLGSKGILNLTYFYAPQQVRQMRTVSDNKAQQIVSKLIKPGMTDLQKEKALHDYVVLNARYDEENYRNNNVPKESYTAYGILINGVGVCEGYANAMDKLLKLAGIETNIITGTATNDSGSGSHAWNLVKISGKWYHLDTTWDDPVPDRAGKISYDYFNLTDQEIRKDHSF